MEVKRKKGFMYRVYRLLAAFIWCCWGFFGVCIIGGVVFGRYVYPLRYREYVSVYSETFGLDAALIYATIKTESNFNEKAVSGAGAIGLMQIKEETGEYIAQKLGIEVYDLNEPETNINFGCFYLKYLIIKFRVEETAVCAYNAGEGNVSLWLVNDEYSKDGKTLENIPFKETREYVKKIYENIKKYRNIYGKLLDKTEKNE